MHSNQQLCFVWLTFPDAFLCGRLSWAWKSSNQKPPRGPFRTRSCRFSVARHSLLILILRKQTFQHTQQTLANGAHSLASLPPRKMQHGVNSACYPPTLLSHRSCEPSDDMQPPMAGSVHRWGRGAGGINSASYLHLSLSQEDLWAVSKCIWWDGKERSNSFTARMMDPR